MDTAPGTRWGWSSLRLGGTVFCWLWLGPELFHSEGARRLGGVCVGAPRNLRVHVHRVARGRECRHDRLLRHPDLHLRARRSACGSRSGGFGHPGRSGQSGAQPRTQTLTPRRGLCLLPKRNAVQTAGRAEASPGHNDLPHLHLPRGLQLGEVGPDNGRPEASLFPPRHQAPARRHRLIEYRNYLRPATV